MEYGTALYGTALCRIADDLVLVAETTELLLEKLRKWKRGMEMEGLRVNAGMTKVMRCRVRQGPGRGLWKRSMPCVQKGSS